MPSPSYSYSPTSRRNFGQPTNAHERQTKPACHHRPEVAEELVAQLTPRCERIEIAGSLRRGKADVGDIELLYVPRIGLVCKLGELFAQPGSLAEDLLEQWVSKEVLRKRPNINGNTSSGIHNKLALHVASGIPVDLFATTIERWFVALVIRTGSKDMNVTLASSAQKRGMKLEAYGVLVATDGQKIVPQSEREVFERLGVPYREPAQR